VTVTWPWRAETCDQEGCSLCLGNTTSFGAMRWWPKPLLTAYSRGGDQALRWWYLTEHDMIAATTRHWP
jgi:hypothetical protein